MRVIHIDTDKCSVSQKEFTIGRRGEHEFTEIQIHFQKWLDEWPGATVSAVYWRPDGQNFIITPGVSESPICWRPTKQQLSVHGPGVVELRLACGESRGKKPPIHVYIRPAPRETEDAPEDESPETDG